MLSDDAEMPQWKFAGSTSLTLERTCRIIVKAILNPKDKSRNFGGITLPRYIRLVLSAVLVFSLAACGGKSIFRSKTGEKVDHDPRLASEKALGIGKISDLFKNTDDPNVTIGVNKYIWNASLDVLSFLPVEAADPFSGVIVTGWGRAAGSSRSYRATIYIQDPALDARSLRVALVGKSGPANKDTIRAIEDAILTRARQMRIADAKL